MLRTLIVLATALLAAGAAAQTPPKGPPQPSAQAFAHQGAARDAQRYEGQLKTAFAKEAAGKKARDVRVAADKLLAAGTDPRGAMRQYATVVVLEPRDAEAWLGLARSLLLIKADPNAGSERFELPVNATAAAYIAYERAASPGLRARALAVLGEAFKRRAFWRPAIDAMATSLVLSDSPDVRKSYEALRAEHGFRMMDYKVENELSDPRLCIQFSERLQRAGTDLAKFVSVDGREPDNLSGEGRQLCIDGLVHGRRYEVQLRTGLPSEIGETLIREARMPVYVRDRAPTVRFTGRGYVLPSRGQQGVPIVTINTEKVDIEVFRIGDRNLNAVVSSNGDFLKQLSSSDAANIASETGTKVYTGTLDVATRLNEEVTTAVPVSDAVSDLKPGVYVMTARAADTRQRDSDGARATQWFIISDLGLAAFSGDNGIHAFVRSIATAEPIANAGVRIVARNNEVLAQARSDGAGYLRFEPGLVRGEGGMAPAILIAETANGQYAFLDLQTAAFDLSDRGVKGRDKPGALDGFLYAERGVYRPGESVHLTALVRDRAGSSSAVPMTLVVSRPDGVEHARVALADQGLGGRNHVLALKGSAMTGTWRARLYADPKADPLSALAFLVEDFVPERLDMKLTSASPALVPDTPGVINLSGRYLYGPPAANLGVEGEIVVKPSGRDIEGYPGYRFGLADEKVSPVRKALENLPSTNAKGEAPIEVTLPAIPRTAKPLVADIALRLRESGGRSIERSVSVPVDPGLARVGIKPQFADDQVGQGEEAAFEVVLLNDQGRRAEGKPLAWTLYRLERNWQWYRRDDTWTYDAVTLTRRAAAGSVTSSAATPARIAVRTEWGRYRLDVTTAEPGGSTSSVIFSAGWYGGESADTPEMLEVGLDKASYRPGETARLKVVSRQGGKLLVTVLGNGLHSHRTIDLPNGGGEVGIEVAQGWGAGAYVAATLYRQLDERQRRMPTRALGLKWLAIDQADRTLKVALGTPEKVGSGSRLAVPVKIDGLARGEEARVTVAAVDVGILNLTKYQSPRPENWFWGQVKLGTEVRDLYGRLIDGMRAERGRLRSGGDEEGGGMSMSGTPPVEATLAFHSGILRVGPDGTARAEFDLPDFNGQLRVMAVAWSQGKLGSAASEVIVRDPVALTVTAPRFVTIGDEARVDLALHNVEAPAGAFRLAVEQDASGKRASVLGRDVGLAANERRSERFTIKPTEPGLVSYDVRVTGPGGIDVKRRLTFDVKVPGSDIRRVTVAKLQPKTGKLAVSADMMADLIPGRTSINVSVGPLAAFDIPGLLTQLDRYPYGCAEQTVSRALPLVYANDMARIAGLASDPALKERIGGAIERVLEMQDSSGAFGVWGPRNADMWLTAYVTDFLTRAREAGHQIPPRAFGQALDRLQSFVSYAQDFERGGEDRAYALYVLARNGRAPIGELRYFVDTRLERFATTLAKAQLGAALAMLGDRPRAERAFRAALADHAKPAADLRYDYGSGIRDGAALLTLASETKTLPAEAPTLAGVLAKAFADRQYTSTQEQAWMLLAARAIADQAREVPLTVNGAAHRGSFSRRLTGPELRDGSLVIGNDSDAAVDAVVSVIGAALTPEPAIEKGFKIERTYYTLDGKKVDMPSATGGRGKLDQTQRLVVVVKVEAKEKGGRVLLVDRLPAGLEIENPRIVDSADLKALDWLKVAKPEHAEFRDDRFVAAFNFTGRRQRAAANNSSDDDDDDSAPRGPIASATVAYIVRAVTPGSFVHPAATVEDMYRPERFARTATGRLDVTARE